MNHQSQILTSLDAITWLINEARTLTQLTGLSPSQLLVQRDELLEALERILEEGSKHPLSDLAISEAKRVVNSAQSLNSTK